MRALLLAATLAAAAVPAVASAIPPQPPIGVPECEVLWEDTALTHNIPGVPQPRYPTAVWCDY